MSDAEGGQSLEEGGVTDGVEGCTEIEEDENVSCSITGDRL